MTTQNNANTLPLGAVTAHQFVEAMRALLARIAERYSAYRTLTVLERLSDRQLDDVGLTRGDVEDLRRESLF